MLYNIQPGDTLLSIASKMTLSPAYADALLNVPSNEGQATYITEDLTGRGVIEIPDNWLKSGGLVMPPYNGRDPANPSATGMPSWVPIAFIATILLLG